MTKIPGIMLLKPKAISEQEREAAMRSMMGQPGYIQEMIMANLVIEDKKERKLSDWYEAL